MNIVFYDGVCGLCNRTVRFIITRDPTAHFHFCALQSDTAKRLLAERGITQIDLDTLYLIDEKGLAARSTAVLRICRRLRAPWPLLSVFLLLPRVLRDACYDWISRRRYRWLGRYDTCRLPDQGEQARFLS